MCILLDNLYYTHQKRTFNNHHSYHDIFCIYFKIVAVYQFSWLVGSLFNNAFSVTRLYSVDDMVINK
jgi:hypothetical protein